MSTDSDSHWHATAYRLRVGPLPASFFTPLPVLPFYHPVWFMVASVAWMVLVVWLSGQGLGLEGLVTILRRLLQGRRLPPRL